MPEDQKPSDKQAELAKEVLAGKREITMSTPNPPPPAGLSEDAKKQALLQGQRIADSASSKALYADNVDMNDASQSAKTPHPKDIGKLNSQIAQQPKAPMEPEQS